MGASQRALGQQYGWQIGSGVLSGTLDAVSIVQQLNQENDLGNVEDDDRFEKHF